MLEEAIHLGDNMELLPRLPSAAFQLIYLDPPFNTGREQRRLRLATDADDSGDRTGFGGRTYRTTVLGSSAYDDRFDDYLGFLEHRRSLEPRADGAAGCRGIYAACSEAVFAVLSGALR